VAKARQRQPQMPQECTVLPSATISVRKCCSHAVAMVLRYGGWCCRVLLVSLQPPNAGSHATSPPPLSPISLLSGPACSLAVKMLKQSWMRGPTARWVLHHETMTADAASSRAQPEAAAPGYGVHAQLPPGCQLFFTGRYWQGAQMHVQTALDMEDNNAGHDLPAELLTGSACLACGRARTCTACQGWVSMATRWGAPGTPTQRCMAAQAVARKAGGGGAGSVAVSTRSRLRAAGPTCPCAHPKAPSWHHRSAGGAHPACGRSWGHPPPPAGAVMQWHRAVWQPGAQEPVPGCRQHGSEQPQRTFGTARGAPTTVMSGLL